ncbi:hypothetical protein YC2023_017013 [Brassica napus]
MKLRTKSFTEISKRANILLDSGFNARLSYFGLAREGPKDDRSYVTAEIHRSSNNEMRHQQLQCSPARNSLWT